MPAREAPPAKALILHSFHCGHEWTDLQHNSIAGILERSEIDIEVRTEYMDTFYLADAAYRRHLTRLYEHKFEGEEFDVIAATGDSALGFLLVYRDRLFPETPVVFCGVQGITEVGQGGQSLFTGTFAKYPITETLDTILCVTPACRRVVVYGEDSPVYFYNRAKLQSLAPFYSGRLEFEIHEPMPFDEILAAAAKLPRDAALLVLSGFKTGDGEPISEARALRELSRATPAPIYGCKDTYVGEGALGGCVVSAETQGQTAGRLAVRILRGEDPHDMPVLHESPSKHLFDYAQMRHFGIPPSRAPAGSFFLNEPQSILVRYRKTIIAMGLVLFALLVFGMMLRINILLRRRAQVALADSERRFRRLVDQAADAIFAYDLHTGRLTDVNAAACRSLGYSQQELAEMPITQIETLHGIASLEALSKHLDTQPVVTFEGVHRRKDGTTYEVESRTGIVEHAEGCIALTIARDITERKRAEAALRLSEERYRSLIESLPIGLYRCHADEEGRFVMANPAMARMFGYDGAEEFVQTTALSFYLDESDRRAFVDKLSARGHVVAEELRLRKKGGDTLWVSVSARMAPGTDGSPGYYDGLMEDITERKRLEDQLRTMAMKDSLTGLANRGHFLREARAEFERARRFDHALSLIMVDADHFKKVNDTYGHAVGDEVLKALAKACQNHTREVDRVGRLGGEEFVLMLVEADMDKAKGVAERLRGAIENMPIEAGGHTLRVTVSLGVAELLPQTNAFEELLNQADLALYAAKQAGRNRLSVAAQPA